ncbi:MAG: cation transporter, partial [Streptococcus sp.]|nr:cation transporter [Streptococcus sp.]
CANTVKERFSNVPGVTNVEVSLEDKVATVEGDASVDALQASLEGTKYSIKK